MRSLSWDPAGTDMTSFTGWWGNCENLPVVWYDFHPSEDTYGMVFQNNLAKDVFSMSFSGVFLRIPKLPWVGSHPKLENHRTPLPPPPQRQGWGSGTPPPHWSRGCSVEISKQQGTTLSNRTSQKPRKQKRTNLQTQKVGNPETWKVRKPESQEL